MSNHIDQHTAVLIVTEDHKLRKAIRMRKNAIFRRELQNVWEDTCLLAERFSGFEAMLPVHRMQSFSQVCHYAGLFPYVYANRLLLFSI